MNNYDDSDDYSLANSFRARSNTWPLNRPDLNIPDGVCIDEPLPEIELEEDDLFTTNENWSTGLVDNDIMSWGTILSSQCPQPNQQQQPHQQHLPQTGSINNNNNIQQQHVNPHQQHNSAAATIHHQASSTPASHLSHQQQSNNNNTNNKPHSQPQQVDTIPSQNRQHQPHHIHQQQKHDQQQQPIVSASTIMIQTTPQQTTTSTEGASSNVDPHNHQQHLHQQQQQHHAHQAPHYHQQQQQQQQQVTLSAPQQQRPSTHQTLNSAHLVPDQDDLNDYHVRQLHHLRLDSGGIGAGGGTNDSQQHNFAAAMSSMCIQENTVGEAISNDINNYEISSDSQHRLQGHHHQQHPHPHHHHHHHHQQQQHEFQHLQPLNPARYDLDQRHDFDVKPPIDDNIHLHQHTDHQHHHHHHPHHQQQLHMTSSSLDNCSASSHLLSTSLSTSGIGLGRDLEDLDYKPVDPSAILTGGHDYESQAQQRTHHSPSSETLTAGGEALTNGVSGNETKQSNSTSSSKTKLNTPRRNAWGNMSYADLISQAINSTTDKRLTLSQIYDWMVQHVPYFKDKGDSNSSAGWKNSVRHNLSLHNRFKRLQNEGTGKSSWWTINPEASIGKCARRRAASMEASKYEKKRGRAKKRAEAIRRGLISYPSLTDSSLNGSLSTLEPPLLPPRQPDSSQQQSTTQLQQQPQQQQQTAVAQLPPQMQAQQLQPPSQQPHQQQQQQQSTDEPDAQLQVQQEQVSNQLQIQLQQQQPQLQLASGLNCDHISERSLNENGRYTSSQDQSQYYYQQQFELSTAL